MVFSTATKIEIYDRVVDEHGNNTSELRPNQLEGFRLEVAHLDHTRNDNYDNPDNGLLVTSLDHYAHHLLFMKRPRLIGLSKPHNQFAIQETCKRAEQDAFRAGWNETRFRKELKKSTLLWINRLGIRFIES